MVGGHAVVSIARHPERTGEAASPRRFSVRFRFVLGSFFWRSFIFNKLASFVLGSFSVRFARFPHGDHLFSTTSQLRFRKKRILFFAFFAQVDGYLIDYQTSYRSLEICQRRRLFPSHLRAIG
ncbi:MAG: hypothetical protein M1404_01405 [Acidobacteria bacterium]|nr:hypothetical protein [Acidobacteriota bacterium]